MLRVEEVGAALMPSLRRDVSGACYGVFPDAPLMLVPDPNQPAFGAYILAGKVLA